MSNNFSQESKKHCLESDLGDKILVQGCFSLCIENLKMYYHHAQELMGIIIYTIYYSIYNYVWLYVPCPKGYGTYSVLSVVF